MKLSDYIPQIKMVDHNARNLDKFTDFIEKSGAMGSSSNTNYTPTFGVDQYTNAWITSRVGYRRQLLLDLWSLYLTTSEVRGPITIIRNEVFRRGYTWSPKFAGKCSTCGKEYQEMPEGGQCDLDGGKLVGPDEEQKKTFEAFGKKVNIFEQTFDQVMGGFEDSLNWADDGFLYLAKEYISDSDDPNKIQSKVNEMRVVNPAMMEMDLDDRGRPNNAHYVCYMHRDQFEKEPGVCKQCQKEFHVDRELVPARWVYFHQGTEPKYLLGSEVLHHTKFTHSETTGVSPLLTLYDEILSLVGMRKTCFDGETEVLTKDGWKYFKDVGWDDVFATYNEYTNSLEYQKPTDVIHEKYEGPMVSVSDRGINLFVTPNHRMWVKRHLKDTYSETLAKDIVGKELYYQCGGINWEGKEKEYFTLPSVPRHMQGPKSVQVAFECLDWDYFCDVVSCYGRVGKKNDIYFNITDQDAKAKFIAVLNKAGVTWAKHKNSDNGIRVFSRAICQTIRQSITPTSENGMVIIMEPPTYSPPIQIPMDLWLEFLGYWLSEGNLIGNSRVEITQISNRGKVQVIQTCLDKMKEYGFKWHRCPKGEKWYCHDNRLHDYLLQFGKAGDKFIPRELLMLSKRQLRILFEALMLGDGYMGDRNHSPCYVTKSIALKDNIEELCLKLGWSTQTHCRKSTGVYTVCVRKRADRKSTAKEVDFNGDIYCVTVPNSLLLTRRKGSVVTVVGNTYRYFFERKLPAGMLLVATDDPDGLRREKAAIETRMRTDPDYMPMVAYSAKGGTRGRVDFVKLYHNLLETDYLPIREYITQRIAAIWGVSPIWTNMQDSGGGISTQSVTGDTPLFIRRDGKYLDIIPIGSLYKDHSDTWYNRVPQDIEVWTESGWSKIKGAYRHRNIDEIRTLVIGDGLVKVTGEHSVKDSNGNWKNAREFSVDNSVKINPLAESVERNTITKDLAWVLGFWCAEGDINNTGTAVNLNNNDIGLLKKSQDILDSSYLCHSSLYNWDDRKCKRLSVYGKGTVEDIRSKCLFSYEQKYGHNGLKSVEFSSKKVPVEVLNGSIEIKEAFLEGYYMGDGRKENSIEMKSVDSLLSAGVKYLCNVLGYTTSMSYRKAADKCSEVYTTRVLKKTHGNQGCPRPSNQIKRIEIDETKGVWVYDIETEDHSFVTAFGGIVLHNSQQLVVTGRVVTSDQDRFNKLIFPWVFDALGITDWTIKLLPPEEKAEETQLRFMQQKVTAASQLRQMGFTVKITPGRKSIDDISFEVTGEATDIRDEQAAAQGGQADAGGAPAGGGDVADVAAKGAGKEPNKGAQKGDLHSHGSLPPHSRKEDHNKSGNRKVKQETGGEKEESDED